MNRIYRHIWSKALGRLVVVPECARGAGGGKAGRRRNRRSAAAALLSSTMLAAPVFAQDALPTGGQVVSGSATITTNGAAMTIDQSSGRMIANWQGFSIGAGNSVTFNQPDASSVALNRVTGQDPSRILGNLNANGQVFLVNPNGIAIGTTGRVQTGAFVASTLGITDDDFLADTYSFAGTSGAIVNEGEIRGGTVALIAPSVTNAGTITGNTALAGGTDVLLDFDGDGLLSVEVRGSTVETLVENKGLIKADGGVAILTAKGASAAMKGVVNNTGTVEANAIGTKNGRILLLGDMQHGEVRASGKLKAKKVETSAAKVKLDRNVKVETSGGHWLIDPTDITIDADYAATLQANLASGDITISTAGVGTDAGNITVASAIAWSANTLELIADNNIAINAALSGGGGLTLRATGTITAGAAVNVGTFRLEAGNWLQNSAALPGFATTNFAMTGGSFLRVTGGDGSQATPYVVTDVYGMQGIGTSAAYLAASWQLANDINAAGTANWSRPANSLGWIPIGIGSAAAFTGRFDGRGHVVSGAYVSQGTFGGLFGITSGATIENIGTREGRIASAFYGGGLVARATNGTVIRNAYSAAFVQGAAVSGGLVGAATGGTTISNSYATGFQSTGVRSGGLVGTLQDSTITGSFASGLAYSSIPALAGGLVGEISNSTILNSYWDTQSTGRSSGTGEGGGNTGVPIGLTTAQAMQRASYAGFDFANTWFMIEGATRPFLRSEWQSTITNVHQLQLMAMKPDANYTLGRDIDFSTAFTASYGNMWATSTAGGAGFSPVGDMMTPFTGTLDGNGHTISNLRINRPTATVVGLFGNIAGGSVRNVGLVGGSVSGRGAVGALAGSNNGWLENVYAKTAVTSAGSGSGGYDGIGGLVGVNLGTVRNAYATGSVTDTPLLGSAGGLIGLNVEGNVGNVYATGSVTGGYAGGLIGNTTGTLTNAYATGAVYAGSAGGGLIGISAGVVSNVYASGAVNGEPSAELAGLVAYAYGTVTNAFWNPVTTGRGSTVGIALDATGMRDPFRFIDAGWDFASTWAMSKTGGAPVLRSLTGDAVYDYYIRFSGDISRTYGDALSAGNIWREGVGTGNLGVDWGSAINAQTNAGRYGLADSGVLALSFLVGNAADYYIDYGTSSLTINKRVLSVSGSRTYDGSDWVDPSALALSNFANGETLALAGIGRMDDRHAGNGKRLWVHLLELADGTGLAANYQLVDGINTVDIARATISSVTGILGLSRIYDGTTGAVLITQMAQFNGGVTGDDLNVTGVGRFSSKNVGSGKRVDISDLVLGGADAHNYTLADTTGVTSADIWRATISGITGITGIDRVYDGTAAVGLDLSGAGFENMVAGDQLMVASATGALFDKRAGQNRIVSISGLSLGGADADNYTLGDDGATTTANIARAAISAVTGITAAGRTYDGTTGATLSTASAGFAGMIAGDSLTVVGAIGQFSDKNAAAGKRVDIGGITLSGADAANYILMDDTATTTADIAKATISAVTGIAGIDRTYDGTAIAGLDTSAAGFLGKISGDALTVASATGTFGDKKAEAGKAVAISQLVLGGADAGNYILADDTAAATATIGRATISAVTGITAANKVYDGGVLAALSTGSAGFTGMIAGDGLTVASATGAFLNRNAGIGKTVAITGLVLGGLDADNYTLADTTAATTADIAKRALTVEGFASRDKIYDGTDSAWVESAGTLTGVLSAEDVGFTIGNANFSDKNAAMNKVVTLSGIQLSGADAGNYTLAGTTTTTASISRATISAVTGITAADKTYDGSRTAVLSTGAAGFTGSVAGDTLTVATATGSFDNRNAGTNKTVAISGLTLGGLDAGNYILADTTATAYADITRATISAVTGIAGINRIYDGTTQAGLNTVAAGFTGMIAGDALTVASATGAFADRNAGTGKAIDITGLVLGGADADNYVLADTTATATADIARATLTLNGFAAAGKVYDGTTAATVTAAGTLSGLFLNDDVTFGHSGAAFADKNAGSGKTVRLNGITLSGADAGNYAVADAATTADIARASITSVSGIKALDKTYDGNRAARLDATGAIFAGLVAGGSLTIGAATGRFDDANPGQRKAVRVTGLTLGGLDAGNYVLLDDTAMAQADIRTLLASPLPPVAFDGGSHGSFDGAFFTLSTRAFLTEPVLIDFSAWQPGEETDEDIE